MGTSALPVMNDLPPETHERLDKFIASNLSFELPMEFLLCLVIQNCKAAYADIWPVNELDVAACRDLLRSRPDIKSLLETASAERKYSKIRNLRMSLGGHRSKSALTPQ